MINYILGAVLLVIFMLAVRSSIKHFKGEGGCCGGGSVPKPKKKRLQGPVISKKVLQIDGMHCENCKNRVEASLNEIAGVTATVQLKKNQAVVQMSDRVEDSSLKHAVEDAGYTVKSIEVM